MKALILILACFAAGCSIEPLPDQVVNDLARACIQAGGSPQVLYANRGQYGQDYDFPVEVRCHGLGPRR